MKDVPEISVVVPVFNSAATLARLVERLHGALDARDFEVLLVNDGSHDGSWDAIRDLARGDPRVRGLDLVRNYGQPNALLAGIRAARGAYTVLIDDDLQHPPEEIPRLVSELERGFDVVYGVPQRRPHSPFRNLSSWLTKLVLQRVMRASNARDISSFVALRTSIRRTFESFDGPFVSIDVLFAWGTARFSSLVVRHAPRAQGRSNYNFWRLASYGLTMITGFSALPLRLASLIGFLFTLGGFAALIYVLMVYFSGVENVPGFTFLASIIAIFSGAQLFALGIIGEYLARMHARLLGSPTYVVAATTDEPEGAEVR